MCGLEKLLGSCSPSIPSTLHWKMLLLPLSLQSCPTLCDPMDSSPSGSSVHGILQARILEWVAISFSLESAIPEQIICI